MTETRRTQLFSECWILEIVMNNFLLIKYAWRQVLSELFDKCEYRTQLWFIKRSDKFRLLKQRPNRLKSDHFAPVKFVRLETPREKIVRGQPFKNKRSNRVAFDDSDFHGKVNHVGTQLRPNFKNLFFEHRIRLNPSVGALKNLN